MPLSLPYPEFALRRPAKVLACPTAPSAHRNGDRMATKTIRSDPRSRAFGPNRQREGERGALAQLALNPNPPPVQLHELLGQCQAEPRPLLLAGVVPADLTELLEDRRLILRRDPDPRVAD